DTAAAAANTSLTAAQWKTILDHNPKTGSTLASLLTNLQAAIPAVTGQTAPVLTPAEVVAALFANPALKIAGTLSVESLGYGPAIADTVAVEAAGKTLEQIVADLQKGAEDAIADGSFGFPLVGVLSRLKTGGQL